MQRRSSLLSERPPEGTSGERRFYAASAVVLLLAGLTLLFLPAVSRKDVAAFAASWLLFIALLMSLIRPLMYSRGVADAVMAVISAFLYGLTGWAAGSSRLSVIDNYRLVLCATLLSAGLAKLLVFIRMISSASLPMLAVCCAADTAAAGLLLLGAGGGSVSVFWAVGMAVLFDAAEETAAGVRLAAMYRGLRIGGKRE